MRFYNPTPRQYQSTYVDKKLPYEFLAGNIRQKEKDIDEQLGTIKALHTDINGLPVDIPELEAGKQQLESILEPLRNINPTKLDDPNTARTILDTTKKYKQKAKELEDVYGTRLKMASDELKNIQSLKNEDQRKFLLNDWKQKYYNRNDQTYAANYKADGSYNPIGTPDYWEMQDYRKQASDIADKVKSIAQQSGINLSNIPKGVDPLSYILYDTKTKDIDKQKLMGALGSLTGNPDVAKSAAVERINAGLGNNFNTVFNEELNPFIKTKQKDSKGKEFETTELNNQTQVGRALNAAIMQGLMHDEDLKYTTHTSEQGKQDYGYNLENFSPKGDVKAGAIIDNNGMVLDAQGKPNLYDTAEKLTSQTPQGVFGWFANNIVGDLQSPLGGIIRNFLSPEDINTAIKYKDNPVFNSDTKKVAEKMKEIAKEEAYKNLRFTGTPINPNGTTKSLDTILLENQKYSKTVNWDFLPAVGKDWENTNKAMIDQGFVENTGITKEGKSILVDNILGDKSKNAEIKSITFEDKTPKIEITYLDSDGKLQEIKSNVIHEKFIQKVRPIQQASQDFTEWMKAPAKRSESYKQEQKDNFEGLKGSLGINNPEDIISTAKHSDGGMTVYYQVPNNQGGKTTVAKQFDYIGTGKSGEPMLAPNENVEYPTLQDYIRGEADKAIKEQFNPRANKMTKVRK